MATRPTEGTPDNGADFSAAFEAASATGGALPTENNVPPADPAPAPAAAPVTPPAEGAPPADGAGAGTEPAAAPAAGDAVVPPASGETPPAAAAPAPAAPAAPAGSGATPPAPSADDIVSRLADVLKAQPAGAPPAQPAAQPAPAAEQAPIYTPDELQVLTDYEKNWPDVAKAETLRRRVEYHDLLKFVFTEVSKFVQPTIQRVDQIGNTLHLTELKAAVPDYSDTLETDVAKWVETQPSYLQGGMKQVMQTGSSDEVADLIKRYRESTGVAPAQASAPAAAAAPAAPPAAPKATELSNAAKQAAESLAPVGSDRTQVPQGEPQDYESAFAKYAAETQPT